MQLRVEIELGKLDSKMNTRLKGGVKSLYAIRSQEHDTLVVLEQTQEDGDEFVALHRVARALFEENIALVEKQNGSPLRGYLEDAAEIAFGFVG